MSEVVSLLTIDARGAEQGSAAYVRAMNTAQAAVDRLADAEAKAEIARARQTLVMTGQAGSVGRTARQWDALRTSIDPILASTRAIEQAQIKADAAFRRGIATQEEAARIVDLVRQKHATTLGVLNDNSAAMGRLQKSTGLAGHELVNLSRQAQDVFVSLASGQAPLTVLIQQGTQIADVFANSQGTFLGFMQQAGAALLRFVPALAIGTSALYALYAAFTVSGERRDLANSLLGAGRAAGITGDQLNQLAKDAAASADITVSSARAIAGEFTKTGKIAPAETARLIKLSKDYAATTGQELEPAVKELATALSGDLSRGAEALNQKLGFLDATMANAVRRAVEFGDRARAQKLIIDALNGSVVRAEEVQTKWNLAWDRYVTRPLDRVKEAVGAALSPADNLEKEATLRRQIVEIEKQEAELKRLPGNFAPDTALKDLQAMKAGYQEQLRVFEAESKLAQDRALLQERTVRGNTATREADSLFANANKDVRSVAELNKALNAYEEGLRVVRAEQQKMADDPALNSKSIANLTEQEQNFTLQIARSSAALKDYREIKQGVSIEQDKAVRLDQLAAEQVGKTSLAEQAAAAGKRVLIELRGTENSAAERSRMAEEARQRVLLQGAGVAAEQRRATQESVDAIDAETQAVNRNGLAAVEVAKLRAQAARDVRGTDQNTPEGLNTRFQELLQEATSKVNREIAEQNAKLKEQADLGLRVNATAKERNLSEEETARLLQLESDKQALINKLRSVGTDEATIASETAKLVVLKGQELSIEKERAALGLLATQRESIDVLQLEIAMLGRSTEERNRAVAALKAEQALKRQGIDPQSTLGQQYVDGAKLEANLNSAKERYVDFGKELSTILGGVFDDVFTKTDKGFKGVAENALKSFARLGSRLIENQILKPLLQGQDLTTLFGGGAANDNIAGVIKPLTAGVSTGAEKGVFQGVIDGFKNVFGVSTSGGLPTVAQGGMGPDIPSSGLGGYGGIAVGGLAGFGIGYQSQSPIMGAIGGALSGFAAGAALGAAGGLPGAIIGGIAGLAGGMLGNSSASKKAKQEREKQAQENYTNAQPQILELGSKLRGEPQGTLAQQLAEAKTSALKLGDIAFFAGKVEEQHRLYADFLTYEARTLKEFRDGYAGQVDALANGVGPDSPFGRSRDSVKSLGDQLKVFIDNTKTAFGDAAPEVARSREAARSYALTVLDGSKELSVVATRMEEIRGAGAGLQQVLVDLGMSADDAANSIDRSARAALDRLKATFESDLGRKTNDARGAGYLNEVTDLLKEVATLRSDAASLGTDPALVTDYFSSAAQSIVNSADLTGQAFADLLGRFPDLIGVVREAGVTIDQTARAIEAASRRLGYQDRLFGALNDTSTLSGQLAAFDRQAERERAAEIKAGGDAINELESALAAERLKIITDFATAAAEEQKRALQEAQNFFDTFSRNLRQFVDGLRTGSDSPLSPQDRLAAARSQFDQQYALALGGDRDAVNSLTTYASAFLDANKAFNASSAAGQAIYNEILTKLDTLPDQVSAEQFIVDAINTSRDALIASIDTNGDGFISMQEATNAGLGSIFRELDTNGDGQISALELIRGATSATATSTDYGNAILAQTQGIVAAGNSLQGSANSIAAVQVSLLDQIRSLNDTQRQTLQALQNQFGYNNQVGVNGLVLNNNMVEALNKIVFNTASTVLGQKAGAPYAYAEGGWITGGVPNRDSVPLASGALGMPGEFVVSKAIAQANAGWLPEFNDTGRLPYNPLPVAIPFVANQNGSAAETHMLREEIRAVREELAGIKRAVVAAAVHVREGVDRGADAQVEAAREAKLKRRAA